MFAKHAIKLPPLIAVSFIGIYRVGQNLCLYRLILSDVSMSTCYEIIFVGENVLQMTILYFSNAYAIVNMDITF